MAKKKTSARRKTSGASERLARIRANDAASSQTVASLAIVEDERGHCSLALRSRLAMNRETFSRMVPTSVRNLASIESGGTPAEPVARRLNELRRVVDALSEVIKQDAVGPWLIQPNDAFDGLKPIEVIERGEVDRIWEMIYFMRSGAPS